jgi:lysophospholipase L1-like esterase
MRRNSKTRSRQKTIGKFGYYFAYCSRWLSGLPIACFLITPSFAQDTVNFVYKSYNLENASDNVIQNAAHLDDFYESLYRQRTAGDRKINIIHIGDSHIQADYLTHAVRKNFQQQFGNAGRGLVVPARVGGTNEAFNIQTSSTVTWKAKRCVYPDQPLPIGIGGITINTNQPDAKLYLYMNDLWLDYSFNTFTLFFQKDITSFNFSIKDTAYVELGFMGPFTNEPFVNYSKIVLPYSVGGLVIETLKSTPAQTHATIFGMNLENGKNGILYHAIGVNGAKYTHYNAAMFFSKQTTALQPDLFIISLGTNEALDYPYIDRNFFQHIDKLITSLRENNPGAKFVLVTPSDAFRKKIRVNPGITKIRELIIQYAAENGLAFWDMYRALGGDGSATAWRKSELLRADGIHYTKDGYEYQGNLLYHALLKGYNSYVSHRHP